MKCKRFLSVLLAALLAAGLLAGGALAAAPDASAGNGVRRSGTVTYINPEYAGVITQEMLVCPETWEVGADEPAGTAIYTTVEEAAAELRKQMESRAASITVYVAQATSASDAWNEVYALALTHTGDPTGGDYLERHLGGARGSYSYSDGKSYHYDINLTYTPTYYTTAAQETELDQKVDSVLASLKLDGATDYTKVSSIYRYICDNVTYDYENLDDDDYLLKYTAYAAMINGTAVCQGYASLFYRMALEVGVDARYIRGWATSSGGNHGWNIVQLGGLYYNLDATWDAGNSSFEWFLLSPSDFKNHTRRDEYDDSAFHAAYPMDKFSFSARPRILREPQSVTAAPGASVSFSVQMMGTANSYQWQYKEPSGSWTDLSGETSTKLTFTAGAQNGYRYRCLVVDNYGTQYSAAATLTIKKLDAPKVSVSNDAATGRPHLTIGAVTGADSYEIYRSTSKASGYKLAATVTGLSWTDPTAEVGKTYHYKVHAVRSGSRGEASAVKSVVTDCARPEVSVSTTAWNGKPTLEWKAVSGADSYEVYRSTSKTGGYKLVKTVSELRFVDGSAVAGVTYYYKVHALSSTTTYSRSAAGGPHVVTCDCARPTLTELTVRAWDGKPAIRWDSVAGADSYEIYRSTNGGTYYRQTSVTQLVYVDSTAMAGVQYSYKIKAIPSGNPTYGASAFSNAKSCTCDCARPEVKISIQAATGLPTLKWDAVSGADQYEIYRSLKEDGGYTKLSTTATIGTVTSVTYTDSIAHPGVTYYYKIHAVNTASTASRSAASFIVKITCDCARPALSVSIRAWDGKPALRWGSVAGADSYEIYRSTNGGTFSKLGSTTELLYVDSTAQAGNQYSYKVRAVPNASPTYGTGAFSYAQSVTADCARPTVSIALSAGKPKLSWKAVSGAGSVTYEIYRSDSYASGYTKIGSTTAASFRDTTAKAGTTYYYKVHAVSSVSSNSRSAASFIVSIKSN